MKVRYPLGTVVDVAQNKNNLKTFCAVAGIPYKDFNNSLLGERASGTPCKWRVP